MPPTAAVLATVKSVVASLNVKVTVAVLAARLTSLLLTSTEAVGVTVSTAKPLQALVPVPGLPLASDQLAPVTLTMPLLMSVPALAVKVAV